MKKEWKPNYKDKGDYLRKRSTEQKGVEVLTSTREIMIGSGDAVFHTDVNYGMWLGDKEFSKAPFSVDMKGSMVVQKIKIGFIQRSVSPGENIQAAINEVYTGGGGEIILQNGVHYPGADIVLYSGVYLSGQNINGCVIDFLGAPFGIKAMGTNAYTAGTVSVNNGSTTVTGAGTAWTAGMATRNIMLSGYWYGIQSVNVGAQTLELSVPFADANIAGASYTIADTISDIIIKQFTVRASSASAIEIRYCTWLKISDVLSQESLVGLDIRDSSGFTTDDTYCLYNYSNFYFNNFHYSFMFGAGSIATLAGHGLEFYNCSDIILEGYYVIGSVGDGIHLTNCSTILFLGDSIKGNGGQGAELDSGNNRIQFLSCAFLNNGSDGIRLTATSDNCQVSGCQFVNNGGYGWDILANTCDYNSFIGDQFVSNVSGKFFNAGTNTVNNDASELQSYTVALLPTTYPIGSTTYATNGRKAGEGPGAGTGVMVFFDNASKWIACDTGTQVQA